jgi:MFS transporter, DHA2 family, multidrug resistance protein
MTDAALPSASQALEPPAEVNWRHVYLGFGGLAIGQFMALLDIQIVASAIAEIQSGIEASADEIAWIQSIYLLAEVVAIPITAYLTKLWGTRPFYVGATIAFIITSIGAGLCNSIETMIVMRALQGLAAGAMIPSSFAIAMTVFPPERRLTANVLVGTIVTFAPTIGPTLGGHLAEWTSWRWLFFVNVIPGLLVIYLVGRFGDFDKGDPSLAKGIDWFGLGVMSVFLLAMQYVLEEGAGEGWFRDDLILWLSVLVPVSGAVFIWRQLTYRQPIVSLAPFQDRNFSLGIVISFITSMSLYGGTFLLPLYLAHVRQFSAAEIGTTMLVSGLTMFLTAPILSRMVRLLDYRMAMVFGLLLTAWSMGMGIRITGEWGFHEFMWLQILRGVGSMFGFIAASQMSIATMPVHLMKDASGLISLMRNVGGAMGMALMSTVLAISAAAHFNELNARMSMANPQSQDFVSGFVGYMAELGAANPEGAAYKAVSGMLHGKAMVLAYGDAFAVMTVSLVLAAVLAFFAAPPVSANAPPPEPR